MKIRSLALLFLVMAAMSLGQLSYGQGSDTQPQYYDNNNPYRTPATEREVQMPYGTLQHPGEWRTVRPVPGPPAGPSQGQQGYQNDGSQPSGMTAEERELWRRGILHRGRNY